jgi:hypothetical protein
MQLAFVLYKYFPLDCGLPVHRQVAGEGIPGLHPGYVMTEPV